MTKLEPGQRRPTTRRRWLFLALVVGSGLAVLVVGTLFGVLGDSDPPPVTRSTSHPPAPGVAAPAVGAPPIVRTPPTASGEDANQTRQVTTHGADGSTTTTVVSPDGTVSSTTTTSGAQN